jgi:hypothetical protein
MSSLPNVAKRSTAVLFLSFLIGGNSAFAGDQPKPVVVEDAYYVAPASHEALWEDSGDIVKVRVTQSEAVLQGAAAGSGSVFTKHRAKVLRVFKGAARTGVMLEFLQSGGVIEMPDRIIKSNEQQILSVSREYVIFLKKLPQFALPVISFNNFGAFGIERARVVPLAGNTERRGMSEARFAAELDRLRLTRGGGVAK